MRCTYCMHEIMGRRHENLCVYNPKNTRKIVLFLKDYVLTQSKFNKQFSPFPSPREFDIFCRHNKIARVKTIVKRYLDETIKLSDWYTEILDYALNNGIIAPYEFPYFLQFIYDAWTFHSREEYQKLYEETIAYEDGEPLTKEIFGSSYTTSATIERLRQAGKMFKEERYDVRQFLT